MGAGRPSLYKPEYCETVVALGRDGLSVVEMAANIGVSRNTLETVWPAEYPEFLEALEFARDLSQSWWEEKGRTYLVNEQGGPTLNTGLYSRSMAARFPKDWREKNSTEVTGQGGGALEIAITRKIIKD